MATQGRKSTASRQGAGTAKRTGSSRAGTSSKGRTGSSRSNGRNGGNKKGQKGNDTLTNVFLGLLLLTTLVLAVIFAKQKLADKDADANPAPTAKVTEAPTGSEPSVGDGGDDKNGDRTDDKESQKTEEPAGTPAATGPAPEPTATTVPVATQAPEPTAADAQEATQIPEPTGAALYEPAVSEIEANQKVASEFWGSGDSYRVTLIDKKYALGDKYYYRYEVLYKGQAEDYTLLLEHETGELFAMKQEGSPEKFTGVKKEQEETDAAEKEMTEQKAAQLLEGLSASVLMLPAELSECTLSLDEWKTLVNGEECYCLNVFYQNALAGSLYFNESGTSVYYLDEFGEFVRVR